jgi:hypothetical protein
MVRHPLTAIGLKSLDAEAKSEISRTNTPAEDSMKGLAAALLAAGLIGSAWQVIAQAPLPTPHPSFAGTWAPAIPAASDQRFNVGLTLIPGQGRLSIEQRANRLTVTITIPDDKLDPMLAGRGRFYPTVIYYLFETRPGGYGAAGPPKLTQATWIDDRLVIPNPWPGMTHPTTQTYSLDGDRLKIETRADMGDGRESDVPEWFTLVK